MSKSICAMDTPTLYICITPRAWAHHGATLLKAETCRF